MTSVVDLLPQSLKHDDFIVAAAEAFEIEIQALYEEFLLYSLLSRVDNLPEVLVDFLAYEKHVDFYEDLTLQEKRNVVQEALEIHRKKGTKYALLRIFDLLNLRGKITEWFEYDGEAYHFKIDILEVSEKGISDELLLLLDRLVNTYKNNRSWLEVLTVYLTSINKNIEVGCALQNGEEITVYPYAITNITMTTQVFTPSTNRQVEIATIYPKEV